MKRIFILRHAKSSWGDANLSDFERPLNDRGLNVAPFMGELIARRGVILDAIVSSPAMRASQTAKIIKESAGLNVEIKFDDRIYEASPNTLRQVISELGDNLDSAMLVGHNPGIEGFIRYLTGRMEPMPTAALAIIKLKIDHWQDITADSGKLVEVIRPKDEMQQ
ncbi:MAG TPA: histidine phosphatase family protein [Pyrinomonadaceae bacterium]|nr:histidine phosphatase family protein [Pyrinomonadaceae bacterium]